MGLVAFSKGSFLDLKSLNRLSPFYGCDVVMTRQDRSGYLNYDFDSTDLVDLGDEVQRALNNFAAKIQRGDPI